MHSPRWLERILLAGFDDAEVEDITRDVRELAEGRGGVAGTVYYWVELLKYPVRNAWDALRYRRNSGKNVERERGSGMESLWKDTRYATRALARTPGFTVTAITIIAVGMGAATAIFTVVDGVLLEPLPVEEPDRLVSLWLEGGSGDRGRMTPGNFVDISEVEGIFSHVAAFQGRTASLSLDGAPVFIRGSAVTPAYFETLGVRPLAGRTFREDEGELGGPSVVILSHHVWEQMFGADPGILRRSVNLDGVDFQVVGVLPTGVYPTHATVAAEIPFTASNQDFFVPLRYSSAAWANRRSHLLGMIGRLAPAVAPETARAGLASLSARLQATEPLNQNERVLMTSFTDEVVGDVRFALLTLLGTVALVLFISIVNVGALFALRADDRRPSLAIRAALGAPRRRLLRQVFLESALIAAAASLAAFVVARGALQLMRGLVPYQIPRLADVGIDGGTLIATMVVGAVIATALGVAPALRLRREEWTRGVGRIRHTPGLRQRRAQAGVVALQAGLCVVVLVGAALLSRSYAALRGVDTGFEEGHTWAMSIPEQLSVLEEITRRVRELPAVAAAAIAYDHPLARSWGDGFVIEGVERSDTDPPLSASLRPFGEGYFRTVGIDVVEGRVPDAVDLAGDVGYAVINQSLAEMFFGERTAIGARIIVPTAQRMFGTEGVFEIVGIVRDVRFLGPDQPASPALYVPLTHFRTNASTLLVRAERADAPILTAVRQVVAEIDPGLGVQRAQRLSDILDDLLARPRFNMMLLVAFAMLALALCGLGSYGLVARVVAMRVREIGIQMALGANRARLARSVMGSAIRPVLLGVAVGLGGAVVLARLIRSLLFGVSPADPLSLVASPSFVLLVGVVAALAPTLRAVSIDPASSLRNE